jgi:hypothetical protein
MELSDHEIERFKAAWERDFGEAISVDFARSELSRLLTFLHLLAGAVYGSGRPAGAEGAGCDTLTR